MRTALACLCLLLTPGLVASDTAELSDYFLGRMRKHGLERAAVLLATSQSEQAQVRCHHPETATKLFGEPIDAGAMTPAFTSLLAAILVGEERLSWDKPASKLYRRFSLGGGSHTPTLEQLLGGYAGIPAELDYMLSDQWSQPADVFSMLRQTPPAAVPGERFEYSLAGIAAAGYLLDAAKAGRTGEGPARAYADLLKAKVFKPLGMQGSRIRTELALAPATGLESTLEDLFLWLESELKLRGGLTHPIELRRRWKAGEDKEGNDRGLGWYIRDYQQVEIIAVGGASGEQGLLLAGIIPNFEARFLLYCEGPESARQKLAEDLPLTFIEWLLEQKRE